MDPLAVLVLKIFGGGAAFALFVGILCRAVVAAKKAGRAGVGGQLVLNALMLLSFVTIPDPEREVATESQKQKQSRDGSGDPDSESPETDARSDSTDP